jgi:aminotransferase EvaB
MQVPFLDLKREESVSLSLFRRVTASGRFIAGPEVAAFESAFATYCGVSDCVSTGNGTDALEIALRAADIKAGDEVATVANAGLYATTAIRAIGAVPLYIDVDPRTLLMCTEALRSAIGERTRAVVVTHLYGQMAPVRDIAAIAENTGLVMIEDCAQAHGAKMDGRSAGSWGLAGCYSFYPTKNLGAYGDAGALITSDVFIAERARALRQYGWIERFHSATAGGRNSRMDEIQAAILAAKLGSLDRLNSRRRAIAQRYCSGLAGLDGLRVTATEGESFVAHLFVVRCPLRDRLRSWLSDRGITTEIHYPVPDHLQASQAGLPCRHMSLTATERSATEVLSLPCFPSLTDTEVDYVLQCVTEWPR